MKSLLDVQDEINVTRNFIECAFMACHELPDEQGHPLVAVLDAASRMLSGVSVDLEHMKLEQAEGGSRDRG